MNSVSQTPAPARPSLFVILTFFTGIPLAFWSCKCLVMLIFQRKLIYLPYLPFGARKQTLDDVPSYWMKDIECQQVSIPSEKGITLYGILATTAGASQVPYPETVIVYFQGNAGSPLNMILPFQYLLTSLRPTSPIYGPHPNPGTSPPNQPHYAILSIAPRSYWKSTRKSPSERAITTDYLHVLHHALDQFPHSRIIVFGHSLGAAAAICLLSQLYPSPPSPSSSSSPRSHSWKSWFGFPTTSKLTHDEKFNRIQGLVLENPFSSIPDMIHAFYPEKWLPHHYLGPLAADKWDCVGALRRRRTPSVLAKLAPDALVLQSESDEVVPKYMGETIYGLMQSPERSDEERKGRLVVVKFAHHSDGWTSPAWAEEIKRYLELLSVR